MKPLLDKLFGEAEEINGAKRCPTYLYRWTILKIWGGRGIYLHHFVGEDWSRDLHDHPKRFVSIGLKGSYTEETLDGERLYRAPWVRTFPANHIHRLRALDCWTLVIVLKVVRQWGFWPDGVFVHWKEYVESLRADKAKSCE